MKNILFAGFLCVLTFSACKKDNNSSTATGSNLSASISGTAVTFNNALVASNTSAGGFYGLQIVGFNGTAGTSDALYLLVYSPTPIAAGTYVDGQSASINYVVQSGGTVTYSSAISPTNPISITITSINSTSVTGTFKGDVFASGNNKKVLTNGQFSVKF
jgi:hypothetical protein